jgi:hypothetical protein
MIPQFLTGGGIEGEDSAGDSGEIDANAFRGRDAAGGYGSG